MPASASKTKSIFRAMRAHAIGILLIVTLWAGLGLDIYWDYETQSKQAHAEILNLANVLSEQVNRILLEADQLARMVEWEALANNMAPPLAEYVRRGAIKLDVFFQVSVFDSTGRETASSTPGMRLTDAADREYFKVHLTSNSDQLFISRPLVGRITGRPSIHVSRRINHPDGSFAGVVAIALDATYFTNFYKELAIGKGGQISIVGTNDRLFRARRNERPDDSDGRESLPLDSSIYRAMLAEPGGVVLSHGIFNAKPRLYGYDKLDDFPLTVTVGFSEAEVMAPYTARRNFLIALGLIITLLIAGAERRRVKLLQRLLETVEAERVSAQAELEKNDRLNSMFKAIPDGVLIFTDQGNIERGNQLTAQMLGLDAEALDGLPTADFVKLFFRNDRTPERQRKIDQLCHILLNAQNDDSPEYFTVTVEHPSLSVFEFHIRYSRSGFCGGVAVIRDVTVQSQLERVKSDFISTAAHELRTPMAGILGFTELLKAGRITSAQHEDVFDLLHERAKTLNDVLSELLDLARLEALADQDFNYEWVDVCRLCRDVLQADPVFATRVELHLGCDDVRVRGDRVKLTLALRNLIENAIKYSAPDAFVQLIANYSGEGRRRVHIEVRDEGIGMSETEVNRAFEKFYRADKSGTVPGTGLGLALVREIVSLHGGVIYLQSQLHRGTTVTVELDVEQNQPVTLI